MRVLKVIVVILIIVLIGSITTSIVYRTHKKLDLVICSEEDDGREYIDYEYSSMGWDRAKCRAEIEKMFGNPKYIYKEVRMDRSFCMAIIRVIGINDSLYGCDYMHDLAHELVHLTEWVGDERYTEYRTFVRLYESEIPEIHEAGRRMAIGWYMIRHTKSEYNCWYQIKEYLKKI